MAEKLPLVYVDGQLSQLPTGDTAEGAALGSLTAGSGLVGGGDLQTGNKRLDVALASSASGVIFVGDSIGMDGADLVTASAALASGVAGSSASAIALASGVAAQSDANTALASGNAALDLAVNFSSSSSVELTASSVIQAGNPVGLDDAGKASVITTVTDANTRSFGSATNFDTSGDDASSISTTYDSTNDRVVVVYKSGTTTYGLAVVGTVSDTSISFGTPVVFETGNTIATACTYDSTNDRVVISYADAGNSEYGTVIVGTVSGTSISFGTAVVFESAAVYHTSITYDSTNNRVVIFYSDGGNSSYGTAIVGTVSGTSISFGAAVVFETNSINLLTTSAYDSTNDRVVVAYRDPGNSNYGTAVVGAVSGTSISFGTPVVFDTSTSNTWSTVYDSTNNRIVITYQDGSNGYVNTAIVGTVSGTAISFGTKVEISASESSYISAVYDSTNNKVVINGRDSFNSDYGTAIVGTVSGTSISFGTAVVFSSATVYYNASTYDSTNNRVITAYADSGLGFDGYAIVSAPGVSASPTISSQNNFIGSAQTTVASGEPVTINVPRSIGYNNTGLSTGYFYYVDPTTSGYTTASGEPSTWNGDPSFPWRPIAKAVSSSGLLILETI